MHNHSPVTVWNSERLTQHWNAVDTTYDNVTMLLCRVTGYQAATCRGRHPSLRRRHIIVKVEVARTKFACTSHRTTTLPHVLSSLCFACRHLQQQLMALHGRAQALMALHGRTQALPAPQWMLKP